MMPNDKSRPVSFPLRLPVSMRRQAIEIAEQEGLSLNQFISLAVAEKLTRLEQLVWVVESRNQSGHAAANLPGRNARPQIPCPDPIG